MTILKVQFNDEIRRVTIEDDCTLAELSSKIRYMFPQLRSFTMSYINSGTWVEIESNEDLLAGIASAKKTLPPVFRISVKVSEVPSTLPVVSPTLFNVEEETTQPSEETSPVDDIKNTQPTPEEQTTGSPVTIISPIYIPPISIEKCSYCMLDSVSTFKCINCYNFAICQNCEAQKIHNSAHLLVKMNRPLDQLPLKQQLIFTQHIEGTESDKTAAKTQSKSLRRAIREASARRKEDRARKERAQRRISLRKGSKSSKKSSSSTTPVAVSEAPPSPVITSAIIDVLTLLPCENAVVAVAPVVEESTTPSLPLVEQIKDASPQKVVEDVSIEPKLIEIDESMIEAETFLSEDEEEKKEEVVEVKEQEMVEVQDEELESEKEEEEVEETQEVDSWTFMNLFGGWTSSNQEATVNVNDYRIQGIAFQTKLDQLEAMGFTDRSRNMVLLAKNLANLERTVENLTC